MKRLFCAVALAALSAACSSGYRLSRDDPDVPINPGRPEMPAHVMSSQGFSPSPILTPAEEDQDKIHAGAGDTGTGF
jgi:hypothetical protein